MSLSRRRGAAAVGLLSVATLLTACGSNVTSQQRAGRTAELPGISALGGDSTLAPDESADLGYLNGPSSSGHDGTGASLGNGAGGQASPTALPGGSGDGSDPASNASGSGVSNHAASSSSTLTLGLFISDDASAIYKSLGISGASHTRAESRAIWQAIINQVNARGGVGGRQVRPSYYFIDSESGSNASRSQAACELFTQDVKAFAVIIDGASDLSMASCLAKHRTPAIDIGQTSYPYDSQDLAALSPYLYLPGRLSLGRFATYIDTLASQGFFSKGSAIGLLRFDLPNQLRARSDVLEPALKRHGLELTADFAFSPVEGTGDLARAASEASAAVLQFRRAGVNKVLYLGSGLSLPYVFPTVAESQRYRPTYGITTDDGPDFMATNAPAAQMTGAMAVGWEPQYDVPDSDAVLKGSAVWQQCAAVMRKAGFTPRDGRRCTGVYFLEAALRGVSSFTALTPQTLAAGVGRIGSTAYSTQTYATYYSPGRFDGVSAVRALAFDASCTCFRYRGGDRQL